MILWGAKQLEGPKGVSNNEHLHDVNDEIVRKEVSTPFEDVINDDANESNEVPKDPKQTSLNPFTSPLSFPQRMAKTKLDLKFGKFLEVLKKLYINIPFIDALLQMPSYVKF